MTEQFRPHPQPENPKHNAPEAGARSLGLPPPEPKQQQGEGSKSPERDRRGQGKDTPLRRVRFDFSEEAFEELEALRARLLIRNESS